MLDENRHLRMAYHDGTLEIVSPHASGNHEKPIPPVFAIIVTVDLPTPRRSRFEGAGAGRHSGVAGRGLQGFREGEGIDESYYIANVDRLPRDRDPDLGAGDPPPDLWIEVDDRVSSKGRLPIYAALGVPEVWRFRIEAKVACSSSA